MEPLDLSLAPPRPPRAELAGVVFLPRSIDKVRASLPGGNLGDYEIEGFTETMLELLKIPLDDFTEAVRTARDDGEVADFVTRHADRNGIAAWNAHARSRQPFHGNRERAVAAFPMLAERPDITYSLDLLAEDDRRAFATT